MKKPLLFILLAALSANAQPAAKKLYGMTSDCRNQAAKKYEVKSAAVTIKKYDKLKDGHFVLKGIAKLDEQEQKRFQCIFDKKQKLKSITKWAEDE